MVANHTPTNRPRLHRARRMLAGSLVAAAAATSLMVAAPGASAKPRVCANAATPIVHSTQAQMQRAVVCLINQQRTERHLPALQASPRLDRSAEGWTHAMVGHGQFSHGSAFMNRISAAGFDWSNVAENIATGYATPDAVVSAWMASPGHCANILDPVYREVGTGVANGSIRGASNIDGTWTQDFGLRMGQHALSENFSPARACRR